MVLGALNRLGTKVAEAGQKLAIGAGELGGRSVQVIKSGGERITSCAKRALTWVHKTFVSLGRGTIDAVQAIPSKSRSVAHTAYQKVSGVYYMILGRAKVA